MGPTFRQRLHEGSPLLLDAAMGTELARRGADTSPPLWSVRALYEAPEFVEAIHRENLDAGADVLTIASFRLHARNVRRAPPGVFFESESCSRHALAEAVRLARRAAEGVSARPPWIAGSLAPLEDCYRPDLVPPEAEILSEHAEMARRLADAGVDLILVETMNTVREASAAASAAAETGLPVVVCLVTDGAGRLLSGEPIEEAAAALLAVRPLPEALGVNCVPARRLGADLARLRAAAPGLPLAAYGNTGRALDEARGLFTEPIDPEEYAALASGWLSLGARLVGGCCGTTAAHTRALRAII
jgi:S-methylmethionine-dependent homocysteine/selenocysteine methylase